MSFNSYASKRSGSALVVTLSLRGVPRTMKIGRAAAISILTILPLLGIWYLGATAYFVFHDQLLASLMSRQADMQYSYEDRIAVLKTQLDRETSRALVDRQTLTTTVRDLAARSEQLAARAVTIDNLVKGLGETAAGRGQRAETALPPSMVIPLSAGVSAYDAAPASPALRLDDPANSSPENHVELSTEQTSDRLTSMLAGIEASQIRQVTSLRDPMIREVARLETALAETGLPISRFNKFKKDDGDVGGPFVPLPEAFGQGSFEQNVALLQDAVVQHARLSSIVEKLPLRRPLQGRLEVTSPFGARLDPFYGRAAMHTGVDFMQGYGGPVLATASGTVTVAAPEGGYGNMVEIDHGNGVVTRYGHLSSIDVAVHQKVSVGEIVGRVGSTGRATGPHLHYETRINGEPVDPTRFLKAGSSLYSG